MYSVCKHLFTSEEEISCTLNDFGCWTSAGTLDLKKRLARRFIFQEGFY